MQCPACPDSTLAISDRQGIEIDYCPKCRGVWLDRGELDKLIERAPEAQRPAPASPGQRPERYDDDRDRAGNYRKKSWLHEIFD